MWLYTVTIFLSAFLLFQVEPIIARIILPWFGGSSAVWSTCMLFFQAALLLGYVYAHWLHEKLGARGQAIAHSVILAASLAALPILPNPAWKSTDVAYPALRILGVLAATLGLPYFLLSSTSPLLQAWYARTHKSGMPYRLFALSNLASMLALLTYPFVVEPNLAARTQAFAWSAGYVCFALLCAWTAWRAAGVAETGASDPAPAADGPDPNGAPSWSARLLWTGLAACASVLLLAVTTHLTQDVAAIPFLWILPLSIYLLSFIICFEAPRLYRRAVFLPLLAASLAFMATRLTAVRIHIDLVPQITFFAVALFACCMVCHGELARRKPHPRYLTGFYVTVSLGGALGGVFVGLLAPAVFSGYYEFPIGLSLCAVLAVGVLARDIGRLPAGRKRVAIASAAVLLCAYVAMLGVLTRRNISGYRVVARNFYGQLRVHDMGDPAEDADARTILVHGTINHGQQMREEKYRRLPVSYFCPGSGIGRAMRAQDGPRRIGILGLGCGTLAAYGRAGDTLRIYEINPLVMEIAQRDFTYLRDTPARVETALGDGRLLLEAEPSQQFDVLVMDAFSGDSVPVHLVTREAFQTYFRHLKPGGILAVNITNTYLDLAQVVASGAAAFGKTTWWYDFAPKDDDILCLSCTWALVMDRATQRAHPLLQEGAEELEPDPGFRPWTDDFSNLFKILK
jgi:SAM-dependent methyltransferase